MATLYYPNGKFDIVKPENGTDFGLQELYKLLGCDLIEVLYIGDGKMLVFDEEGKLKPNPERNDVATKIALARISGTDYIAGHCLLCLESEIK